MTAVYTDPTVLWERLLGRVVIAEDGCWIFTGPSLNRGYAAVSSGRDGKKILVHRLAVLVRDGSIADGMTVDHQCHDSAVCGDPKACKHRLCVNPDHLAVMTRRENTCRRWASGLCDKGHPLTVRDDGRRRCKPCQADRQRARRARGRVEAVAS